MSKLPELNRRRLLLGLASASAAGAAIALTGAAVVAAADENATLMRLGDELPVLEANYLAALEAKNDAYRRGMKNWPLAPDILIKSRHGYHSLERDVADAGLRRAGDIYCSLWELDDTKRRVNVLRKAISRRRKDPSKPFAVTYFYGTDTAAGWGPTLADWEARLDAAVRYYAETERLRELSGYEPAQLAEDAARSALVTHINAIMKEPPTTMAGVVIQAQAIEAFSRDPLHAFRSDGWKWSQQFAANLLRIAREAPDQQA